MSFLKINKKYMIIISLFIAFLLLLIIICVLSSHSKQTKNIDKIDIINQNFGVRLSPSAKVEKFTLQSDLCSAKVSVSYSEINSLINNLVDFKNINTSYLEMVSFENIIDWWNLKADEIKYVYQKHYTKKIGNELCRGGEMNIIISQNKNNNCKVYFVKTI